MQICGEQTLNILSDSVQPYFCPSTMVVTVPATKSSTVCSTFATPSATYGLGRPSLCCQVASTVSSQVRPAAIIAATAGSSIPGTRLQYTARDWKLRGNTETAGQLESVRYSSCSLVQACIHKPTGMFQWRCCNAYPR
eukprot:scaffold2455_cov387-Prasinococcus_capsulatus_cf.AAC.3